MDIQNRDHPALKQEQKYKQLLQGKEGKEQHKKRSKSSKSNSLKADPAYTVYKGPNLIVDSIYFEDPSNLIE